jgi:hypothetical protein
MTNSISILRPGKAMHRPAAIFAVSILTLASVCSAQIAELPIGACFNDELQQKMDYSSNMTLALAAFSQIRSDNYELMKKNASLTAVFDFIPMTSSYDELDKLRSNYFEQNGLKLSEYQSITLSTRTLDAKAYGLLKDCIDHVAANTYGFHYLIYTQGPDKAAIALFWNPAPGGPQEIKVTDSYLEGATAADMAKSKYGDKLFPYVSWWSLASYPRIGTSGRLILLDRKERGKMIRINIATEPQVKLDQPIEIAAVPVPTVKHACGKVYEKNDPVTGILYQASGVWDDRDVSNDRSEWYVKLDTPGTIYDEYCWVDAHVYIDDQGGTTTNHAYCRGHQDANPKYIHLRANYLVERTVCTVPSTQAALNAPPAK